MCDSIIYMVFIGSQVYTNYIYTCYTVYPNHNTYIHRNLMSKMSLFHVYSEKLSLRFFPRSTLNELTQIHSQRNFHYTEINKSGTTSKHQTHMKKKKATTTKISVSNHHYEKNAKINLMHLLYCISLSDSYSYKTTDTQHTH